LISHSQGGQTRIDPYLAARAALGPGRDARAERQLRDAQFSAEEQLHLDAWLRPNTPQLTLR
jgi:hypothetical protein